MHTFTKHCNSYLQRSGKDIWLPYWLEGGGDDVQHIYHYDEDDHDFDHYDQDHDKMHENQVTAITILTFGTSQIDLFASKVLVHLHLLHLVFCCFASS